MQGGKIKQRSRAGTGVLKVNDVGRDAVLNREARESHSVLSIDLKRGEANHMNM